jgi:Tol biopolymer transport system component
MAASTLLFCVPARSQTTTLASVSTSGSLANGTSYYPSISADGRYVAFSSTASNLVHGDTNHAWDVFVRDLLTGETTRVSVATDGTQGVGDAILPNQPIAKLSADGRFVAFSIDSSHLVPNDTNGVSDVFVHDRRTGETTRVSVDSAGAQVSRESRLGDISADGRFVSFCSWAENLVPGDTNEHPDVFVRDLLTGRTTRVSVDSSGVQGDSDSTASSISADGRYVAFQSWASNLVPGDTNQISDIFVHDRWTDRTTRVSVSSTGEQGIATFGQGCVSPSISADGRFVAFTSSNSNLVPGDVNDGWDAFVHDRSSGETRQVNVSSFGQPAQGMGTLVDSFGCAISADGRYVAFQCHAANLVHGDTNGVSDIFVHDLRTGTTTRESVASTGAQANAPCYWPAISGDGRFLVFHSAASNLVAGDVNETADVFVRER